MITSNIKGVIARLQRFETGLPAALERAVAPKRWEAPLKNTARMGLLAVAWPEERRWVDYFVDAVHGSLFARGVRWTLDVRDLPGVPQVGQVQDLKGEGFGMRGRRVPLEQGQAEQKQVEAVRRGILEWVREEKDRDPVDDAGLSDAELADRIEWIMGVHPRSRAHGRTTGMELAGQSLAGAVQRWLDEKGGEQGKLPEKRVKVWLQAVLIVWRDKFLTELPIAVKQEIRKQWQASGEKLL